MNAHRAAIVSLLLAPLLWLWPSVIGGRTFVPYDLAQFPPVSLTSTAEQLAAARDGANFDVTEPPVWSSRSSRSRSANCSTAGCRRGIRTHAPARRCTPTA